MKRLALTLLACLTLPMEAARAEPLNLDIATPPVIVIRHSMVQRESRMIRFLEAGIIGLGNDGMLRTRDSGKQLTLVQRQIAEKLIDAENNDRKALAHAIAHDHEGKQARVDEIRAGLLKRWQERFIKSGWWIQDAQGNWVRKP
ncbi:MAG: DUF1318 domain-containing protein [Rhodocyclaceae bacterium]|nr:DUF1318 domain-containing protein [Rhodocyclaceae bacterium]